MKTAIFYFKGEPAYHSKDPSQCRREWLLDLASPRIIKSLLSNITTTLNYDVMLTKAGVEKLKETSNLPFRDVDAGLVSVAKDLHFGRVVEQWKIAVDEMATDSPDAVTRASSLIETLCKHILESSGKELPSKEKIQPLFRETLRVLSLSPEGQVANDLRDMASGLCTVAASIGAFRTHTGTAHGRGLGYEPITFAQARLAVNSAGVLATYLMDVFRKQNTPTC